MEKLSILLAVAILIAMLSSCKNQTNLGFEAEEKSEEVIFTSVFISETTISFTTTEFYETMVTTTTETTVTDPAPTTATTTTTSEATVSTEKIVSEISKAGDDLNIMPEIVFIAVFHYAGENITGHYLTNKGEIKFFNFMIESPCELYFIERVYDKLPEATYDDYYGLSFRNTGTPVLSDLASVSDEMLNELYVKLLNVNINNKAERIITEQSPDVETTTYYSYYGMRYNAQNEIEIVFLWSWDDGRYNYSIPDPYAKEIYERLKSENILPFPPRYTPYEYSEFWQN